MICLPPEKSRELKHYGVLGMKWGVRKDGMPQGWQGGTGKGRRRSAEVEDEPKPNLGSGKRDSGIKGESKYKSDIRNSGETLALTANAEQARTANIRLKTTQSSRGEDLAAVNKVNGNMNCALCTAAYELRRRGYDVRADKTAAGALASEAQAMYKNAKPVIPVKKKPGYLPMEMQEYKKHYPEEFKKERDAAISKVESSLSKQPEGARGAIVFNYAHGGGHVVNYEIINGKPMILDAQSKRIQNLNEALNNVNFRRDITAVRTDNADMDLKELMRTRVIAPVKRNSETSKAEAKVLKREMADYAKIRKNAVKEGIRALDKNTKDIRSGKKDVYDIYNKIWKDFSEVEKRDLRNTTYITLQNRDRALRIMTILAMAL